MSWGAGGAWASKTGASEHARSSSRWESEAWCGWPAHWAGALVTNPAEAQPYKKGEAGAPGAELAWHSGALDPLHTSSNLLPEGGSPGGGSHGLSS